MIDMANRGVAGGNAYSWPCAYGLAEGARNVIGKLIKRGFPTRLESQIIGVYGEFILKSHILDGA